jgi:hypothetical protein
MNDTQIKTLEQVRQFLEGTAAMELCIDAKEDRYAWIQTPLVRFHYRQLSKADKGVLLSFLQKVSGYSRIQVKRQVKQYCKTDSLMKSPTLSAIIKPLNSLRRPNNNSSIPSLNRTTGRPDLPPPRHAFITFVQYHLWIRKYLPISKKPWFAPQPSFAG